MHRQHPYTGYGAPPDRRPNSPPGVGPDRGRGSGRGRAGRFAPRNAGGGPQDYENSGWGMHPMDNPYGEDAYNFRNGDYGEHDNYESTDGRRNSRPARLDDEEKVHDPLIAERLQRERPCRTLFIRNIKYETDSTEFRHKFEEFGEIKTFFDLISHRGMVFCTYYDMRAAERAKERLQGTELAGRPIDVHYSLPRDDAKSEPNQGVLTVTLIDSPTRAGIDDMELRRKLTVYGDVKSIMPNQGRHDSRLVEFYDLRGTEEAHGKLRHQSLQDGVMETEFTTMSEMLPPGPAMQERARQERGAHGRERPRGGPRGRGGRRGGGDRYDDRRGGRDWEEEDYYGRERGRMSPARYEDRWRERSPPPRGRNNGDLGGADREKLEQAKKVQDLLAALKQTGGGPAASSAPPSQSMYGYPPPNSGSSAAPYQLPPNMGPLAGLLQSAASLPPQQAQALAGALSQYQQQQSQPPAQYPSMPPASYPPMPPQSSMYPGSQPQSSSQYGYPPPGGGGNPSYSGGDIYSMMGQKGHGGAPPPGSMPPESARYSYGSPQHGGPPPPNASSSQANSIQDMLALLKQTR